MYTDDNPEAKHIFNTSNTEENKTPCTVESGGKPHISDAAGYQYDQVYASQNGLEEGYKRFGDYLRRCWREQLR